MQPPDRDGGALATGLIISSEIGILATSAVRQLSAADQQKVEILRALARDAEIIIMDEPTARLSAAETSGLRSTVRALAAGGRTVGDVVAAIERLTGAQSGA